jgi:hypothetical protein
MPKTENFDIILKMALPRAYNPNKLEPRKFVKIRVYRTFSAIPEILVKKLVRAPFTRVERIS